MKREFSISGLGLVIGIVGIVILAAAVISAIAAGDMRLWLEKPLSDATVGDVAILLILYMVFRK